MNEDLWGETGNPYGAMPDPTVLAANQQFGVQQPYSSVFLPENKEEIINQLMAPPSEPSATSPAEQPNDDDVILPPLRTEMTPELQAIKKKNELAGPYRNMRPIRRSSIGL